MSTYNRPSSWEEHSYRPTLHPCPCGQMLVQVGETTMLACHECGEVRWIVATTS